MLLSRIALDVDKRSTLIALQNPSHFHGAIERAFEPRTSRALWRVDMLHGQRYMLLLSSLRGAPTRAAHFACAVACAFPNGDTLTADGRCDGSIAYAPLGEGGFGYDPVFLLPGTGKTFGQLTQEEKSAVSHRGRALREFSEKLETYLKK